MYDITSDFPKCHNSIIVLCKQTLKLVLYKKKKMLKDYVHAGCEIKGGDYN